MDQYFDLGHVLFFGGEVRLIFENMVQRQTLEEADDYYVCISYVALFAYFLEDVVMNNPQLVTRRQSSIDRGDDTQCVSFVELNLAMNE